jgi:hypothetical protein
VRKNAQWSGKKRGIEGGEGGGFTPYQVQIQKEAIEAVARGKGRREALMAIEARVEAALYPSPTRLRRLK